MIRFQEGVKANMLTAMSGDIPKVERNMEKFVKVFKQSMVAING
jgi:hypothetical protein